MTRPLYIRGVGRSDSFGVSHGHRSARHFDTFLRVIWPHSVKLLCTRTDLDLLTNAYYAHWFVAYSQNFCERSCYILQTRSSLASCDTALLFTSKNLFYSEGNPTSHIDSTHIWNFAGLFTFHDVSAWEISFAGILYTLRDLTSLGECCLLSRNSTPLAIWAVVHLCTFTQFTPLCIFLHWNYTIRNNPLLTRSYKNHRRVNLTNLRMVIFTQNQFFTELVICFVQIYLHSVVSETHALQIT